MTLCKRRVQVVEEIYDPQAAAVMGIDRVGQVGCWVASLVGGSWVWKLTARWALHSGQGHAGHNNQTGSNEKGPGPHKHQAYTTRIPHRAGLCCSTTFFFTSRAPCSGAGVRHDPHRLTRAWPPGGL